jgi:branched-chain amino acid aminotransferase
MSVEYINFNGSILPADQLIFKANNRGFRYGDGLFESMRYEREIEVSRNAY